MAATQPPQVVTCTPELLHLLRADPEDLQEFLESVRAPDLADALCDVAPELGAEVVGLLPFERAVELLDEPQLRATRAEIIERMPRSQVAPLVNAMSADQQAELFRDLPDAEQARLLALVNEHTRAAMALLLQYPGDTAGGIMTTEFVSVTPGWTVARALELIRSVGRAKETVYALYVLDGTDGVLQHVVSLRELLMAAPDALVTAVGDQREPVAVTPGTDREDVARILSRYNLLAVPVVDAEGRMLGIATVDDVIDAMVREGTEDVQKFGGLEALDEPYPDISLPRMIRKRAGWLVVLFLGEMLTATAMGHFEEEISRAVVLALFIPLIISSGGNSGSQATSLIIRSLALRELTLRDWWRVALRELPSGLALGTILGTVGFFRIMLWQALGWYDYGAHHVLVALTVGLALVGVVTFGSLAGSMLPFLLRRLGFDPASASAPFVATLVDVTGLIIYFSVAWLLLGSTLLA